MTISEMSPEMQSEASKAEGELIEWLMQMPLFVVVNLRNVADAIGVKPEHRTDFFRTIGQLATATNIRGRYEEKVAA